MLTNLTENVKLKWISLILLVIDMFKLDDKPVSDACTMDISSGPDATTGSHIVKFAVLLFVPAKSTFHSHSHSLTI